MPELLKRCALAVLLLWSVPAVAQIDRARSALDLEAAQALIAVQAIDGWLLYQSGSKNPVAAALVSPQGATRPWFYYVPAEGAPIALVHAADTAAFAAVPGNKTTYRSARDLRRALKKLLAGADAVAMEYDPSSKIASLTRVDAGTARAVEAAGVKITSSAHLVQFTKSLWRREGRVAHYIAAHHLDKLADQAMKWAAAKVASGEMVTEFDVQQHLVRGFKVRGLASARAPVVAAGKNTADPDYVPAASSAAVIKKGDLLLIELAGAVAASKRPIAANVTKIGCVCAAVPDRYQKLFAAVAAARDATIEAIRDRVARHRPMRGSEADEIARAVIKKAGLADKLVHATGHSLDTAVAGDGANLDAARGDNRNLVVGSGFTVGPGLYVRGELGVRSEVGVYIGAAGVEVTTRPQTRIPALLSPSTGR